MIFEISGMIKINYLGLLALLLISACQPAPEERVARAEAYFDKADYRSAVIELKNALRSDANRADARLLFARAAFQLGDYATAENEYTRALELGLDRPDVWLGYGRVLMDQGKAAIALERVVPNFSAETRDVATLVFLGDVFSTLGNNADAQTYYSLALSVDARSDAALIGQAVIAAANDDLVAARRRLDIAIELNHC